VVSNTVRVITVKFTFFKIQHVTFYGFLRIMSKTAYFRGNHMHAIELKCNSLDDLELLLTRISRSQYFSKLIISKRCKF